MSKNYNVELFESKVGYDWRIKMMLCRVTPYLIDMMDNNFHNNSKSWVNVIRLMLLSEGKNMNEVNVNGYYNSIKRALKEIGVIRYDGKDLVKGFNWNRFVSDEDWSWFVLNTDSFGTSKIVK